MTHSLCSVMFAGNHSADVKRVSQYASQFLRYLSMVNWDNMQEEGEIPRCAAAMVLGTYENSACMQAKLLQSCPTLCYLPPLPPWTAAIQAPLSM